MKCAGFVGCLGAFLLGLGTTQAQDGAPETPTLTPQDYIDIEQLSSRYVHAIDECTNGGYDYADLYTDDGEFSVAEAWGSSLEDRRFHTQGREALAVAAGGGEGGCRDPQTLLGYGIRHIITAHVITPSPAGATGRSTLLAIGVGGEPTTIEYQGGYEDVYVKTADGWRFKSRIHVFPNMAESVQFGSGGAE